MKYQRTILTVVMWTARIIGILILLLIAILAIGEGVRPNRMFQSLPVALGTVTLLTMLIGQIAAWKWEGVGGGLIVGSFALFAVVNHGVPMNIVFAPWLLTGLLYLGCGWLKSKAARANLG